MWRGRTYWSVDRVFVKNLTAMGKSQRKSFVPILPCLEIAAITRGIALIGQFWLNPQEIWDANMIRFLLIWSVMRSINKYIVFQRNCSKQNDLPSTSCLEFDKNGRERREIEDRIDWISCMMELEILRRENQWNHANLFICKFLWNNFEHLHYN